MKVIKVTPPSVSKGSYKKYKAHSQSPGFTDVRFIARQYILGPTATSIEVTFDCGNSISFDNSVRLFDSDDITAVYDIVVNDSSLKSYNVDIPIGITGHKDIICVFNPTKNNLMVLFFRYDNDLILPVLMPTWANDRLDDVFNNKDQGEIISRNIEDSVGGVLYPLYSDSPALADIFGKKPFTEMGTSKNKIKIPKP